MIVGSWYLSILDSNRIKFTLYFDMVDGYRTLIVGIHFKSNSDSGKGDLPTCIIFRRPYGK